MPRRIKRAYLKRWSATYINAGKRFNKTGMKEDSIRAAGLSMPSLTSFDETITAPTLNQRQWNDPNIPLAQVKRAYDRTQEDLLTKLCRVVTVGTARGQGVTEFAHIRVSRSRAAEIRRYWSGNNHFFVKTDFIGAEILISMMYEDKPSAMWSYRNSRILWVRTIPLAPSSL